MPLKRKSYFSVVTKVASKIMNTDMIIQVNDYLVTWIDGFLIDRKARGLTENTLLQLCGLDCPTDYRTLCTTLAD